MGDNKVFLSACVSGTISFLGMLYLLIACVFNKRRGGTVGGTKELLFLHTISLLEMMFWPLSWDKHLPPLFRYVTNTLLWWIYRFAVQWIYYRRFCAANHGSIQAPWIKIILRIFLIYPLVSVILRFTSFYCSKDEGGYCAPYQSAIYWSLPSIILVDLAYLIGFGVLMMRFEELTRRISQEDRPKTRAILIRYLKQCLITNVLTGVQTILYCSMQKNHLDIVVAVVSIEMLMVNGLLVMIYPDWRLRLWPWGRDRFSRFSISSRELPIKSEDN